jgi:hypothetical protein
VRSIAVEHRDGLDEAGRRVGSGVYFVRLVANGSVRSRKIQAIR